MEKEKHILYYNLFDSIIGGEKNNPMPKKIRDSSRIVINNHSHLEKVISLYIAFYPRLFEYVNDIDTQNCLSDNIVRKIVVSSIIKVVGDSQHETLLNDPTITKVISNYQGKNVVATNHLRRILSPLEFECQSMYDPINKKKALKREYRESGSEKFEEKYGPMATKDYLSDNNLKNPLELLYYVDSLCSRLELPENKLLLFGLNYLKIAPLEYAIIIKIIDRHKPKRTSEVNWEKMQKKATDTIHNMKKSVMQQFSNIVEKDLKKTGHAN